MFEVLLLLIAFIAGYFWGQYRGRKHGFETAQALLPLLWRQQSYEQGKCILCQGEADGMLNEPIVYGGGFDENPRGLDGTADKPMP
ncbi:MAG: hypothetical protein E6X17_03385 [Sporomusaceae bacterium]|nr:hypothetical protein [Sporomusaceae bacterium]